MALLPEVHEAFRLRKTAKGVKIANLFLTTHGMCVEGEHMRFSGLSEITRDRENYSREFSCLASVTLNGCHKGE